jgi:pantoate--beta-alanine ligase
MNRPNSTPEIVRTVADLRAVVAGWRKSGARIALVPTMGALHAGHLSLLAQAKQQADRVVVSLFVNPTQFGPTEDLSRYPRDEARDLASLASAGCDLLFAPTVADMYPAGFATSIQVARVSVGLCGAVRPGHFDGVATVVCKLLNQVQPDVAVFGEKDYQQLQVIKRLVADLDIPTDIIGAPIVRDSDGLALSSRNIYLTPDERHIALALPQQLQWAKARLEAGGDIAETCASVSARLRAAGFGSVDYVEVRGTGLFAPLQKLTEPARLLAAGHVGTTRLLDNMAIAWIAETK